MLPIGGIKSRYLLIILFIIPVSLSQDYVKTVTTERRENILFIYEIIKYPTYVEIIDKDSDLSIGISLDPWLIDFGKINEGMSERRYINIKNDKDYIYKARLTSFGNISKMITFGKNNFLIESNEALNVSVSLNAMTPGNYTGEINIVLKRFKYPIFNWLLKWM